jgi:hypothetical protein
MELKKLHEDVFYFTGVIPEVDKLVQALEDTESDPDITSVIPNWDSWEACSGQMYVYGSKKNFNLEAYPEQITNVDSKETAKYISNTIIKAMTDVCEAYAKEKGITKPVNLAPYIGVNKYQEGTFMGTHFDQQEGDTRLYLSLVMYFNDNYEGGEISFSIRDGVLTSTDFSAREDVLAPENEPLIDFWLKPEPGSCLIFPSSMPFSHTAHLVKSGSKYMSPGFWLSEDHEGPTLTILD